MTHEERAKLEMKWSNVTGKIRSLKFTGFEQELEMNTRLIQSPGHLNSGLQLRDALHRMQSDEQVTNSLNEALTYIRDRVYFEDGEALRRVYISSIAILEDSVTKLEKSHADFEALYAKLR